MVCKNGSFTFFFSQEPTWYLSVSGVFFWKSGLRVQKKSLAIFLFLLLDLSCFCGAAGFIQTEEALHRSIWQSLAVRILLLDERTDGIRVFSFLIGSV